MAHLPGLLISGIAVYRNLAGRCEFPLHLGLTEAGMGSKGIVASSTALAVLLQEGIGCVVNGPGESRLANIGISLPGAGENPSAPVYMDGERVATLKGPGIAQDFTDLLQAYVAAHYGKQASARLVLEGMLERSTIRVRNESACTERPEATSRDP